MGKIAWLVVADLHLYYKNISSRIDYVREMQDVRDSIEKIAVSYKERGYERVNMLLLGDVFHRSYQDTFLTAYDNNFFILWKHTLGDVYSVIGNHELHYYSANPFFTLINSIESEKVREIKGDVWTPQGLLPTIRVVDRLEDGEVVFHFNHFSTAISEPEIGKVNIGLFHQDVVTQQIIDEAERTLGEKVYAHTIDFENLPVLDGYSYCFFGHIHKVYGRWKGGNCTLFYLASLGRTNSSEVNNNFLERCVPAVLTEDGKFIKVEENLIQLPGRAECLHEEIVEESKETYKIQKKRNAARTVEVADDNPVLSLKRFFEDDALTSEIIDGLLQNPIDEIGNGVRKEFTRIVENRRVL